MIIFNYKLKLPHQYQHRGLNIFILGPHLLSAYHYFKFSQTETAKLSAHLIKAISSSLYAFNGCRVEDMTK